MTINIPFSYTNVLMGRIVPCEFLLYDVNAPPCDITVHEIFNARQSWRPSEKVYSVDFRGD